MELVETVQDTIVFQNWEDTLFILNLETFGITKFMPSHVKLTLLPSALPNSLIVIKGDCLYLLEFEPQYKESKVCFVS